MRHYLHEPVTTLYFGGGTPSLLTLKQLATITNSLYKHFDVSGLEEFTLEANPDDLSQQKAYDLASLGVNRLSLGTQTFNDRLLQFINRSHTARQTRQAVTYSHRAGIRNLSIDLIYGIPGQHANLWANDVRQALALQPTHLSSYALTIEPRTAFGHWHTHGKLSPLPEQEVAEEYTFLVEQLTKHGFKHYEVSNFCKPGFESRHNTSYWKQTPYIGLGPGAHSYNGQQRHANQVSNPAYLKKITSGSPAFTTETLTNKERLTEYLFTRIRTHWGIDIEYLRDAFDYHLTAEQKQYIQMLVSKKMATFVNQTLILTSKGFFMADAITLALMPSL